ncbi:MAG: hypothetical protein J7530_05530 [Novosphingobium sp.]|nr:hypothetical protein [Novosphingobium sp.]
MIKAGGYYIEHGLRVQLPVIDDPDASVLINLIDSIKSGGVISIRSIRGGGVTANLTIYINSREYMPLLEVDSEDGFIFGSISNPHSPNGFIEFMGELYPLSATTSDINLIKEICSEFVATGSVSIMNME